MLLRIPQQRRVKNKHLGFTLTEVVVSLGIIVFLTISVTMVLSTSLKVFSNGQDRGTARSQYSLAMSRMSDDLKNANGIPICSSDSITYSSCGTLYKYYLYNNKLLKANSTDATGVGQVIARDISYLNFDCTATPGTVYIIMTSNPNSSSSRSSQTFVAETEVKPNGIAYGLLHWWKMDETSNTIAYDSLGTGKDLNYNGGAKYVSGVINNAVYLPADGDYLSLIDPIYPDSDYTITFWIKSTAFSTNTYAVLGTAGSKFTEGIWISATDLSYVGNDGTWDSIASEWGPLTLSDDTWYFFAIAVSYDGGYAQAYYDNGQSEVDLFVLPFTSIDLVGRDLDATSGKTLKIDDLRYYSRMLSADEVKYLGSYLPCSSSGTCSTVDLNNDSSNCGACGNACAGGQSCYRGVCCTTGYYNCSGTCKNLASDNSNCGYCGHVCGGGTTCKTSDGLCSL